MAAGFNIAIDHEYRHVPLEPWWHSVAKLPPLCHFNLSQMSTVKLYLYNISCATSSSFQCTTCGPASLPRSKCTPDAATSLQSNAQAEGRIEAKASSGSIDARDLEGAIAANVMGDPDREDGEAEVKGVRRLRRGGRERRLGRLSFT
jgi:hypothetical protein